MNKVRLICTGIVGLALSQMALAIALERPIIRFEIPAVIAIVALWVRTLDK